MKLCYVGEFIHQLPVVVGFGADVLASALKREVKI